MDPFESYRIYINSFSACRSFSELELSQSHPYLTVLHRTIEGNEENLYLSKVRLLCDEFARKAIPMTTHYEIGMPSGGLSCSDSCHNGTLIRTRAVPLFKLDEWNVPYLRDSINGTINVGGEPFAVLRCFHRTVTHNNPLGTVTVRNAANAKGKLDECALDPRGFCCYWDTPSHATLCIRNTLSQPTSDFSFVDLGLNTVVFSNTVFDVDAWEYCGETSDTAKIPIAIIKIVLKGRTVKSALEQLNRKGDTLGKISRALLFAFQNSVGETAARLDELAFQLLDNQDLPAAAWREACELLEELADEINDSDATYWYEYLKPAIQSYLDTVAV